MYKSQIYLLYTCTLVCFSTPWSRDEEESETCDCFFEDSLLLFEGDLFEGTALFLGGGTILGFFDGDSFELGQGFSVALLGDEPDFFALRTFLGGAVFGDNS